MARKPSKAQMEILEAMARGADLERHFDVYGPKPDGNWLQLLDADRIGAVPRRTVEAMVAAGYIVAGETTRPYSGHHLTGYALTDVGRALTSATA